MDLNRRSQAPKPVPVSAVVTTDTCTCTITKTACQNAKLVQNHRQNMRQTPLSKVGIFSSDDVSLYAATPRYRALNAK